ncbi:alpha/beta fold hydrolase [Pseudonocardia sp. TRM90224]|uniref:alpha/beta fold hydrolase n=1 Tax=Pseudonocardia sp. TRM90224 TaxID=2812678 RepID=UPI001E4DE8D8|nr:alpha/beta hydrolase [Pseudonocardia sp. TRM90224]
MFDEFERSQIDTGTATISVRHGGSGPPVLLLHGFPQSSAMWHPIAPQLAEHHTVVAPDLRGYGSSSRPPEGDDHSGFSFRAMAQDQVTVMRELGHERFAVVGHDRGARVGHRMALDHPDAVERLAVLDILPTLHVYSNVDRDLATGYYHWFFFIQPFDLPERLISAEPMYYLHKLLGGWGGSLDVFAPDALAEYERAFADPAVRHAMLEDYRAGASIDLEHDRADEGRLLDMPVLSMWGSRGIVGRNGGDEVLAVWRTRAADVRGASVDTGHFLVEEAPEATLAHLRPFLSGA